jgi:hypothetical protein
MGVAADFRVAPRRPMRKASTPRRALNSPRKTHRRTIPDFPAGPLEVAGPVEDYVQGFEAADLVAGGDEEAFMIKLSGNS